MSTGKAFALVVIDMSEEQFHPDGKPLIPRWKGFENILTLAKHFPKEKILDSRLWMRDEDHSTLHKLYPDVGIADSEGAKLCHELKNINATFVKKYQYSAFFGSQLHELLQAQGVNVILITGINTDYCVFASALDAFYHGYEVWLIEDACTSITGPSGHQQGIAEFQKYLGNFGKVLTTEKALREMRG